MIILPNEGTIYLIQTRLASGMVLDLDAASANDGAKIQQWHCHGGTNQQWQVEHTEMNCFRIKSVATNHYLTVNENLQVVQNQLDTSKNQEFSCSLGLLKGVEIHLKNNSKKVLNIPDGSNIEGKQLDCVDQSDQLSQSFYFTESIPKKLTFQNVRCDNPSGGSFFSNWSGDIFDGVNNGLGVVGGSLGLAGGVAGLVLKAGTAATVVGGGGIVLGVVGLGLTAVSTAFFVDKIASGEDDLFINLDGKKIWPTDKNHGSIKANQTLLLDVVLSEDWKNTNHLALYDHDTKIPFFDNDPHDLLADLKLDPNKCLWRVPFTLIVGNKTNQSVYSLTFILT